MAEPANVTSSAIVYLNGHYMPAAEARLPVDDHGVLFGFGFFETFRTSGGRPHHWRFNRRRLEQACATAGILLPPGFLAADDVRLAAAVKEMLRRAGCADAVFRYTITAGVPDARPRRAASGAAAIRVAKEPVYTCPGELLALRPLPSSAPRWGVCLRILNIRRDNGEWLPRPKSLNYANALLGAAELARRGADASDEGLFLSREQGFVVETVRQNVAWIRDGRLCYPEPSLGGVAGTCLAWVLELGVPATPCRAQIEEMLTAEAIVVMNSVRGITPVRTIYGATDEELVGSPASHQDPLVVSLRQQWQEALAATAAGLA